MSIELIERMVRNLKKNAGRPFHYFLPSPNEGKRLHIHGYIGPSAAVEIAMKIWGGELTIDSIDCVEEIDIIPIEATINGIKKG